MKITPNGKHLFCGSCDGNLVQYSVAIKTEVKDYGKVHGFTLNCMAIASDGQFLWTGGGDENLRQFNLKDEKCVKKLDDVHQDWVVSICILP